MAELVEGASDVLSGFTEAFGAFFGQHQLIKLDEETSLRAADRLISKWREIKLLPDACAAQCLASQVRA